MVEIDQQPQKAMSVLKNLLMTDAWHYNQEEGSARLVYR